MLRWATVLVILAASVVPEAGAQGPVAALTFTIANVRHAEPLPHDGSAGSILVDWDLACPSPSSAAHSGPLPASITFTGTSDLLQVKELTLEVALPDCVLQQSVNGTAALAAVASPDARSGPLIPLQVQATAVTGPGRELEAPAQPGTVQVALRPGLQVEAVTAERTGAPQTLLDYPIKVTNHGNGMMMVTFQLEGEAPRGWNPILPEVLVVEPGSTQTAVFNVATPYENGPNSGRSPFVVRATSVALMTNEPMGEAAVELWANVDGWYVPGPGLALTAVALVAAGLLGGRKARGAA